MYKPSAPPPLYNDGKQRERLPKLENIISLLHSRKEVTAKYLHRLHSNRANVHETSYYGNLPLTIRGLGNTLPHKKSGQYNFREHILIFPAVNVDFMGEFPSGRKAADQKQTDYKKQQTYHDKTNRSMEYEMKIRQAKNKSTTKKHKAAIGKNNMPNNGQMLSENWDTKSVASFESSSNASKASATSSSSDYSANHLKLESLNTSRYQLCNRNRSDEGQFPKILKRDRALIKDTCNLLNINSKLSQGIRQRKGNSFPKSFESDSDIPDTSRRDGIKRNPRITSKIETALISSIQQQQQQRIRERDKFENTHLIRGLKLHRPYRLPSLQKSSNVKCDLSNGISDMKICSTENKKENKFTQRNNSIVAESEDKGSLNQTRSEENVCGTSVGNKLNNEREAENEMIDTDKMDLSDLATDLEIDVKQMNFLMVPAIAGRVQTLNPSIDGASYGLDYDIPEIRMIAATPMPHFTDD